MKYMLIKELYDCFYTPPELSALRQEIEECHKALIEVLEKPERRLVLQIIDAKDRIAEDILGYGCDTDIHKKAGPEILQAKKVGSIGVGQVVKNER